MKQLHYNVATPLLLETLQKLMLASEFDSFRLVGGTALSFFQGHRESVDIDLFTDALYGTIDFEAIDAFFRRNYNFVESRNSEFIGMGKSYYVGSDKPSSTKVDIYYNQPFIHEMVVVDNIRMATVGEIIAMKLDVVQRIGRKKDFWDLHEMIDQYSLKMMLDLHEERYPYSHDEGLIRTNFTNFDIADEEYDPVCLRGKYWEIIKSDLIDFAQNG
jgi:Nucleotidyl transferase AbiEii toxin, Type IV TA system